MKFLSSIYKTNLSLLTDFYQLTMAYGYYISQKAEQEAVYHVFFRKQPFNSGYSIAAGLGLVIEFLDNFKFTDDDIEYLKTLTDSKDEQMFSDDFLNYLQNLKFTCDVKAVPEGTVVFPREPLIQIKGPLLQCQLLESSLLNFMNFHSLIATKSARIKHVAQDDPVLEFGLRRAQGIDGALSATRAAFIGGCSATSNTLAGKLLDIPVKGTHAHSWVMSFDEEEEAFATFAKHFPDNTVFLVDTYDTIEGIKKAIHVGKLLQTQGKDLVGIRLDSGDLHYLSIKARQMLDKAGFQNTQIVATNDLNENTIASLKAQGAKIAVWGVGTQLVTSYNQPALGGVYKLAALKNLKTGEFEHCIKLSDQIAKISIPGILGVKRFYNESKFVGDMIYDELTELHSDNMIIDPMDSTRFRVMSAELSSKDLLVSIFKNGQRVYKLPTLREIQTYTREQVASLDPSIQRIDNPHFYPAGLEKNLHELKMQLIFEKKNKSIRP